MSPALEHDVRQIGLRIGSPCPYFEAGIDMFFSMTGDVAPMLWKPEAIQLIGKRQLVCSVAVEQFFDGEVLYRKAVPLYGKVPNYAALVSYMAMGNFAKAVAFAFSLTSRDVAMVIDKVTGSGSPLGDYLRATNPLLAYDFGCIRATRGRWYDCLESSSVLVSDLVTTTVSTDLTAYKPYYANGLRLIQGFVLDKGDADVFDTLDGTEIASMFEVCCAESVKHVLEFPHPRSDSVVYKMSSLASPSIRVSWMTSEYDWYRFSTFMEPTPDVNHELLWWLTIADVEVYKPLSDADYRVIANCILHRCDGESKDHVIGFGWSDEWFHNLLRRYMTYRRVDVWAISSDIANKLIEKMGLRMVFRMAGFYCKSHVNVADGIMQRPVVYKYMYYPVSYLTTCVLKGVNATFSKDKYDTRLPYRISRSTRHEESIIGSTAFEECYGFSYKLLWKVTMVRQCIAKFTMLMLGLNVDKGGSIIEVVGPIVPTVSVLNDPDRDWVGVEHLLIWFAERYVVEDRGHYIAIVKRVNKVDPDRRISMIRMYQDSGIYGWWF